MMRITAVAALFTDLGEPELISWIDRGWIHPELTEPEPVFHDIDIARVRLIHDLRTMMQIEDETIPVLLSLLDQVYDLRGKLRSVLRAVEAQPDPVRRTILSDID